MYICVRIWMYIYVNMYKHIHYLTPPFEGVALLLVCHAHHHALDDARLPRLLMDILIQYVFTYTHNSCKYICKHAYGYMHMNMYIAGRRPSAAPSHGHSDTICIYVYISFMQVLCKHAYGYMHTYIHCWRTPVCHTFSRTF